MPTRCETHVFGSRTGYQTLARSPGVDAGEERTLSEFGFGESSDDRFLSGLATAPTAFARVLPSGRVGITRVLAGPLDDGGRATLERRTVLLGAADYAALRPGLRDLLHDDAFWSAGAFLAGERIALPPSRARAPALSERSWRIFDAWTIALTRMPNGVVTGSSDADADDLLGLVAALPARDATRLSWGIRMLAPIAWVDVVTLSRFGRLDGRRQVFGVSSASFVNPEVESAFRRDPSQLPALAALGPDVPPGEPALEERSRAWSVTGGRRTRWAAGAQHRARRRLIAGAAALAMGVFLVAVALVWKYGSIDAGARVKPAGAAPGSAAGSAAGSVPDSVEREVGPDLVKAAVPPPPAAPQSEPVDSTARTDPAAQPAATSAAAIPEPRIGPKSAQPDSSPPPLPVLSLDEDLRQKVESAQQDGGQTVKDLTAFWRAVRSWRALPPPASPDLGSLGPDPQPSTKGAPGHGKRGNGGNRRATEEQAEPSPSSRDQHLRDVTRSLDALRQQASGTSVTWNDAAAVAERSFVAWEKCLNDYRKDYSTAPATADRARNLCLEALRAASAINCAERVYGSDAPKGEELLDLETALTPARDKRHPAANFIDQFRKQAGRWRDFVQKTRHSAGASQQSQPKVPAPGSQIRSLLLRALDQHFTLDQRLQKLIDDTCNPPK